MKIQESELWRFEYKYRLNFLQYLGFRNALLPYMEPDSFSLGSPPGRYLVRSLYFDNQDYLAYREKTEGNWGRIKLRLRTYTSDALTKPNIRVEIKTRKGSAVIKYCTFVPYADYEWFIKHWHWRDTEHPVLIEFERQLHLRGQKPKILVEYLREGMLPRNRDELRITFDHDVLSAEAVTLFPQHTFFRRQGGKAIILEIKCRHQQPLWLQKLVRQHSLKVIANSKYSLGLEAACPDIVHPAWD